MFKHWSAAVSTHLSLSDCPQSFNHRQFDVHIGSLIQKSHHRLHHPRCSLFELGMFLGKEENLVIEQVPITSVLADGYDGNQEARGSSEIRSLKTM